jgi:hypothetical protein
MDRGGQGPQRLIPHRRPSSCEVPGSPETPFTAYSHDRQFRGIGGTSGSAQSRPVADAGSCSCHDCAGRRADAGCREGPPTCPKCAREGRAGSSGCRLVVGAHLDGAGWLPEPGDLAARLRRVLRLSRPAGSRGTPSLWSRSSVCLCRAALELRLNRRQKRHPRARSPPAAADALDSEAGHRCSLARRTDSALGRCCSILESRLRFTAAGLAVLEPHVPTERELQCGRRATRRTRRARTPRARPRRSGSALPSCSRVLNRGSRGSDRRSTPPTDAGALTAVRLSAVRCSRLAFAG